jgi:hypothetical protein
MAPAIVGITAVVYAVRNRRRQREQGDAAVKKESIHKQPAFDTDLISSAASEPLPQIQANLGLVRDEHGMDGRHNVDPDSEPDVSPVTASAIDSPVFPAEEHTMHPIPSRHFVAGKWELPTAIPAGRTTRDEVIAGLSPTPGSSRARRAAVVAAIVVVSAALVYATLGRARSHAARTTPAVQQMSNTTAASVNDLAAPAIEPSTQPVMPQTTEATPPAEGPSISPGSSGTVAPNTHHPRKHRGRVQRPRSVIDKTRTFLRKTF